MPRWFGVHKYRDRIRCSRVRAGSTAREWTDPRMQEHEMFAENGNVTCAGSSAGLNIYRLCDMACGDEISFCPITCGDHCAVLTCDRPRLVVAQDPLCCAKDCMYGPSACALTTSSYSHPSKINFLSDQIKKQHRKQSVMSKRVQESTSKEGSGKFGVKEPFECKGRFSARLELF